MVYINFDPFPSLNSERLDFRELGTADVEEVFELRSNPKTMKFIPRPLAKTIQDAHEHIKSTTDIIKKKEGINWGISLKGEAKIIGMAGFYRINLHSSRCEIGYIMHPKFQNQGFISETIHTLLNFAFHTMNFHSIEAVIDPQNHPSERVLIKNGFVKEAHILENEYWDGKYLDTVIYSLLKRNFIK